MRRNYYLRNRELELANSTAANPVRMGFLRQWMYNLKLTLSCQQCGQNHPATLHFHHRDPALKTNGIGRMLAQKMSTKTITAEIAKCDVLCANCHLILHDDERRASGITKTARHPSAHKLN